MSIFTEDSGTITVESIDFTVAQFLWNSWVALIHEFNLLHELLN